MSRKKGDVWFWLPWRIAIIQEVLLEPDTTSTHIAVIKCAKRGIKTTAPSISNIICQHKLKRHLSWGGTRRGLAYNNGYKN